MKTTFYVYKIGDAYLRIGDDPKKIKIFTTSLVKDINIASYWTNKKDAKGWMIEREYPNAKLIPCGLSERNKPKTKNKK